MRNVQQAFARHDKKRNVVIPFLLMTEEGDIVEESLRKSENNIKALNEAIALSQELGGLIIETEEEGTTNV